MGRHLPTPATIISALIGTLLLSGSALTPVRAASGTFTTTVDNTVSPPRIDITYTPAVNCAKVLLSQTVKPTLSDADGSNAVDCPFKDWDAYAINDITTVAGNTSIDHNFCEKDHYYNGDDNPQDNLKGNQQGSNAGATVVDAKLREKPHANVPKNGKDKFTAEFETCAICADDGTVLGCMTWKYENTSGGAEKITVTGGAGGNPPADPSATFGTAVTKFKDTHTKDGNPICPEKVAADAKKNREGGKTVDVDPILIPPPGNGEDPGYIITYEVLPALGPLGYALLAGLLLAGGLLVLGRRRAVGLAVMLALILISGLPRSLQAATCVSYPSIVAGSPTEYADYEMRFCWIGEAKSKPTFGLNGVSRTFNFADFEPCALPPEKYDDNSNVTLTLSNTEWNDFINRLGSYSEFYGFGTVPGASLSLQILRGTGPGTLIYEHVTNRTGARTMLLLLIDSISPGNTAALDLTIAMKRIYLGDCVNCGQ